jgi:single-strand DNA-binding protein
MRVNRGFVSGNLTRDPELKGGGDVCKFAIAVNDYKDKVHYVDVTAFNRGTYELAQVIHDNFRKGSPIFLEYRLDYSSWEKDGEKRSQLGIVVENFQFIGKKDDANNTEPPF